LSIDDLAWRIGAQTLIAASVAFVLAGSVDAEDGEQSSSSEERIQELESAHLELDQYATQIKIFAAA